MDDNKQITQDDEKKNERWGWPKATNILREA